MAEQNLWRSLRENEDPSTIRDQKMHEFQEGVTESFDPAGMSPLSRKQFLALLAASAAFATAGCTNYRDKGEIVPYTKKPEEIIPGVANFYASTCTGCAQRCGVLIKTREGRPVKIDGNPDHPVNAGSICARGQASILNLYDPSRLRTPRYGGASAKSGDLSWNQVDTDVVQRLAGCIRDQKQIILVVPPALSPSGAGVLADFRAACPSTRILTTDVFPQETRRRAWERCYGAVPLPVLAWDQARVLVTLEADPLGTEGFTVEQTRAFAAGRDVEATDRFSRLYSIEGNLSLTGANADYRLRLLPTLQRDLLLALLNEAGIRRRAVRIDNPVVERAAAGIDMASFSTAHGLSAATLAHMVDDLLANRGKGIVYAGDALPEETHVLANYLNELLGNTTLYVTSTVAPAFGISSAEDLASVVADMKAGRVGVVIHAGTNPVYHLPRDFGYADALKNVPLTICLTEAENETAQACTYMLPTHHALESWGDHRVRAGVYSLQQPVVAPLYATRQTEAVLLQWMAVIIPFNESAYLDYLKKKWETELFPRFGAKVDFATFWNSALHDGVAVAAEALPARGKFRADAIPSIEPDKAPAGYTLLLTQSPFVADGSFANNGWLQEIPHPVSKVVWDNYAALSPATAGELGVESNDLVDVTVEGRRQALPVFVQPGMADKVIAVALGYGRTNAGPVGTGVGTDATPLLTRAAFTGSRIIRGVTALKGGGRHELASTQEHHALDDTFVKDLHLKRKIIREATLAGYLKDPGFLERERKKHESISTEVEYHGVKWGMAIDLNKCTGCNACVAGCNVENNIPVVGKEQVQLGREMQWIRIDRYYSGTPDEPVTSHQPMLCQHCDNAPCENVCPVVATNHSPDGLNQMVYNRCVGTKYCSNNCPFKVRRFNFYNWRDHLAEGFYQQEPVNLLYNPEVTVRSRGVMEKCTFCVQRIMEARQHATEQGVEFAGKDVQTACQQACPAQAIVFGNTNDPQSAVARLREHPLGYHVLEELNVRPNVTYLARLRNIHSEKLA